MILLNIKNQIKIIFNLNHFDKYKRFSYSKIFLFAFIQSPSIFLAWYLLCLSLTSNSRRCRILAPPRFFLLCEIFAAQRDTPLLFNRHVFLARTSLNISVRLSPNLPHETSLRYMPRACCNALNNMHVPKRRCSKAGIVPVPAGYPGSRLP